MPAGSPHGANGAKLIADAPKTCVMRVKVTGKDDVVAEDEFGGQLGKPRVCANGPD